MATPGRLGRLWIDAQEWGLGRLDRLAVYRRRRPAGPAHLATGLFGERAALFELRRRGYLIVAQRWTNARMRGDVDLIAWDGPSLCFIEVKTRSVRDATPAASAVDDDKRSMVRALAGAYLRSFPEPERRGIAVRFDVVSVYSAGRTPQIEILRGAFGWQ
jgi:putative endonuclease